jgi:hypothetical protein
VSEADIDPEPTADEASLHSVTDAVENEVDARLHPIADSVEHKLDPRFITLERRTNWLRWAIWSVVLLVLFLLGAYATQAVPFQFRRLVAVTLLLYTVLRAIHAHTWPAVAYKFASWRVDADGIEVRRGVLFRSLTNVPRSRVQHTDVSQGPLERSLALATLDIYTAGKAFAVVRVRGLTRDDALKIRDFLLPREKLDDI